MHLSKIPQQSSSVSTFVMKRRTALPSSMRLANAGAELGSNHRGYDGPGGALAGTGQQVDAQPNSMVIAAPPQVAVPHVVHAHDLERAGTQQENY